MIIVYIITKIITTIFAKIYTIKYFNVIVVAINLEIFVIAHKVNFIIN